MARCAPARGAGAERSAPAWRQTICLCRRTLHGGRIPMTSTPASPRAGGHRWRFFRVGGLDHVHLETAADFIHLPELDQKLWAALSCPTRGLEFDAKTLDLIDTDKDGRVRVPEILAAVQWACGHLKDPAALTTGSDALPLAAIEDSHDSGRRLLASAREILRNLGKPGATSISLADTTDTKAIFAQTRFNGDGVVPPASAGDAATQAVIADILATVGGDLDRSGAPGVNEAGVDRFFGELRAFSDWLAKSETAAASILPQGEATPAAFVAWRAVHAKIEDYFARCRLAAFDARAAVHLNRAESEFVALAPKDLGTDTGEVAGFPLAHVAAGQPLPLAEGVNPAWARAMEEFRTKVVAPLLGASQTALTAEEWTQLGARLAAYAAWLAEKPGAAVEKLGRARIREILAGGARPEIARLIALDRAVEPEFAAITAVDQLLRYHRDLHRLLVNFVSFVDFYSPDRLAVFQAGMLYLDGRACELCFRVDDMGKHAALAGLSKIYLAYCDCTRRGSAEKMTIAAAVTSGDSDRLMPGRNGVFYDRRDQDWDATIVKIVENPISISQAVWAPYKRMARMIGEQIDKLAAARDKGITDKAAAGIATAGAHLDAGKAAPPPTPFDVAKFAGIFAAIGLAVGAIGTALAAIVTGFLGLAWWQMPLALLGLFAIISVPSALLAARKLRQRNIGPILDANGWAINGRVKINIPFGAMLTSMAKLPANAERSLTDPYANKSGRRLRLWVWGFVIMTALAVAAARYFVLGRIW